MSEGHSGEKTACTFFFSSFHNKADEKGGVEGEGRGGGEETVVSDVTARKTAARRYGRRAVPLLWPLKNSNNNKKKQNRQTSSPPSPNLEELRPPRCAATTDEAPALSLAIFNDIRGLSVPSPGIANRTRKEERGPHAPICLCSG